MNTLISRGVKESDIYFICGKTFKTYANTNKSM